MTPESCKVATQNTCIMKFKENAKTALAKVLSDLIQSDGIVNQGEIDYLRQVFRVLDISEANLKKSGTLTLSGAVQTLRGCGESEKALVLHAIQQLSISDDNIDPSESLFITALLLSLKPALHETPDIQAELISIPGTDFDATNAVVYVESEFNAKINQAIAREFDAIEQLLDCRGMSFFYLPRVMKEIRGKKSVFKQMLRYLEPLLSEEQMRLIEHDMKQFDTRFFSKEIFLSYLNARGFSLERPSLLIKVENLKPSPYQDFLILPIERDPLDTLQQFYALNDNILKLKVEPANDKERRYYDLLTMPKTDSVKDELQYTGFHKLIVDTIVKYHSAQGPSRLRIAENGHLFLVDRNNAEVKIQAIGRALYILYLRHEEGIALHELGDHREELMQIYAMTSGYSDEEKLKQSVDNLVDYVGSTLNPLLSRIKKAFTSLLGDQAKAYLIDGRVSERKKVHLARRLVIDELR